MIDILPEFNLSEDLSGLTAKQFVDRVNNLKEMFGWNDRLILLATATKLKGAAKLWFDSQMQVNHSWEKCSYKLMIAFPSIVNEADVHFQLSQRYKRANEDLDTYVFTMSAMAAKIKLSEPALCQYIMGGIRDSGLSSVFSIHPVTHPKNCLLV